MDISASWDAFLEMEADAVKELEELESMLQEEAGNEVIKQKIEDIKAFFRPYSNDPVFKSAESVQGFSGVRWDSWL